MSYLTLTLGKWSHSPKHEVTKVCCSSNNVVAAALDNGGIWLLEFDSSKLTLNPWTLLVGHHSSVAAMVMGRIEIEYIPVKDNILLSCSTDGEVLMWDLADGRCLQKNSCLSAHARINFLKMTHSGRFVLCTSDEGQLFVLNASTLVLVCETTLSDTGILAAAVLSSEDKHTAVICILNGNMEIELVSLQEKRLVFERLAFWKVKDGATVSSETSFKYPLPKLTSFGRFEQLEVCETATDIFAVVCSDFVFVCRIEDRRFYVLARIPSPNGETPWKSAAFGSPKVVFCSTIYGATFAFYLGDGSSIRPLISDQVEQLSGDSSGSVVVFGDGRVSLIAPQKEFRYSKQFKESFVLLGILEAPSLSSTDSWLSTNVTLYVPDSWSSKAGESSYLIAFSSLVKGGSVDTQWELWPISVSVPISAATPSIKPCENPVQIQKEPTPPAKSQCGLFDITNTTGPQISATCTAGELECVVGLTDSTILLVTVAAVVVSAPQELTDLALRRFEGGHRKNSAVNALLHSQEPVHGRHLIISGGQDHALIIWDAGNGSILTRLMAHAAPLACLLPSPPIPNNWDNSAKHNYRNTVCSIASDNTVSLVSLEKLSVMVRLPAQTAPISYLSWNALHSTPKLSVSLTDGITFDYSMENGTLESSVAGILPSRTRSINTHYYGNTLDPQALDSSLWNSGAADSNFCMLVPLKICESGERLLTLTFNVRNLLSVSSNFVGELAELVKSVFSCLLAWGLDSDFDAIYGSSLGLSPPPKDITICQRGAAGKLSLISPASNDSSFWRLSPNFTAQRLLLIVSLAPIVVSLQNASVEETFLNKLANHYGIALPSIVGSGFSFASFALLAKFYQDPITNIQVASRAVFRATLIKMSRESKLAIVYYWQPYLPAGKSPLKLKRLHERATLIVGAVGSEDSSLLTPEQKRQVAESLVMLLTDQSGFTKRLAAIELIGRAFPTWEAYLNGGAVLRALLSYAVTSSSSNGSAPAAVKSVKGRLGEDAANGGTATLSLMAKQSLMHIAVANTALFFNTLAFDVSHSRDISERTGCLKLFEYFINKKPLILYPHLSEMVDAIVRCLDPNIPAMRECLIHHVTTLFYDLVVTFPHVTFHSGYQRLAVGTVEGLVLIFDLKTATRYQVLEGHHRPVIAVSFSPDGKLICSYSHEENLVRVWQPSFGFFGALVGKIGSAVTAGLGSTASQPSSHGGSGDFIKSKDVDSSVITASSLMQQDPENYSHPKSQKPQSTFTNDQSVQSVQSFRTFQIGNPNSAPSVEKLANVIKHTKFEWVSDRCFKLYSDDQIDLQFTV